jgi:succinyl-diaminopimelate desuccinylase
VDGTVKVVEALKRRGEAMDYCIVGEPTSVDALGDMLKNGRRGSLSGRLTVRGIQGHVAYPHLARNPVHQLAPALAELAKTQWDRGNESFPPTTWQVSNIHAGTGVGNVIPGSVEVDFNFRFSTESTDDSLMQRVEAILKKHALDYSLSWVLGARPFLSPQGKLAQTVTEICRRHTGHRAELSTTGGTSDARFIIEISPEVLELGPVNASIHKLNEHIEVAALEQLAKIYLDVLRALLP